MLKTQGKQVSNLADTFAPELPDGLLSGVGIGESNVADGSSAVHSTIACSTQRPDILIASHHLTA